MKRFFIGFGVTLALGIILMVLFGVSAESKLSGAVGAVPFIVGTIAAFTGKNK
jgi:hypothetical protein